MLAQLAFENLASVFARHLRMEADDFGHFESGESALEKGLHVFGSERCTFAELHRSSQRFAKLGIGKAKQNSGAGRRHQRRALYPPIHGGGTRAKKGRLFTSGC